jgi:translation initiation factor 5A
LRPAPCALSLYTNPIKYIKAGAFPQAIDMSRTLAEVRELKEGRYMIIDEEPCKILSISTSKPGKHGEAKSRIDAVGLFDGRTRSVVHPVKHKIGIPLIDKRTAQVLAIHGDVVQLMDMTSYENFELPLEAEQKDTLKEGMEVMYIIALERRKIMRL